MTFLLYGVWRQQELGFKETERNDITSIRSSFLFPDVLDYILFFSGPGKRYEIVSMYSILFQKTPHRFLVLFHPHDIQDSSQHLHCNSKPEERLVLSPVTFNSVGRIIL